MSTENPSATADDPPEGVPTVSLPSASSTATVPLALSNDQPNLTNTETANAGPPEPSSANTATPPPVKASGPPNVIVSALGTMWVSLGHIWKGEPLTALALATLSKSYWLICIGLFSVVTGLFMATSATRFLGSLDDLGTSVSTGLTDGQFSSRGMLNITFGQWMGFFFVGIILGAIVFLARTLCIKWTFASRHSSQSIATSGSIVAVSYLTLIALLFVAVVLLMIPSLTLATLVFVVMAALALPVSMIPEIMLYIGLNRTHHFVKSPLIPHVLFTLVWVIIVAIAFLIFGLILTESMM